MILHELIVMWKKFTHLYVN